MIAIPDEPEFWTPGTGLSLMSASAPRIYLDRGD